MYIVRYVRSIERWLRLIDGRGILLSTESRRKITISGHRGSKYTVMPYHDVTSSIWWTESAYTEKEIASSIPPRSRDGPEQELPSAECVYHTGLSVSFYPRKMNKEAGHDLEIPAVTPSLPPSLSPQLSSPSANVLLIYIVADPHVVTSHPSSAIANRPRNDFSRSRQNSLQTRRIARLDFGESFMVFGSAHRTLRRNWRLSRNVMEFQQGRKSAQYRLGRTRYGRTKSIDDIRRRERID